MTAKVPYHYWAYPQALGWILPHLKRNEMLVLLYAINHTYGYHRYTEFRRITADEFEHGVKKKDGTRIDAGTLLKKYRIRGAVSALVQYGLLQRRTARSGGYPTYSYRVDFSERTVRRFLKKKGADSTCGLQPEQCCPAFEEETRPKRVGIPSQNGSQSNGSSRAAGKNTGTKRAPIRAQNVPLSNGAANTKGRNTGTKRAPIRAQNVPLYGHKTCPSSEKESVKEKDRKRNIDMSDPPESEAMPPCRESRTQRAPYSKEIRNTASNTHLLEVAKRKSGFPKKLGKKENGKLPNKPTRRVKVKINKNDPDNSPKKSPPSKTDTQVSDLHRRMAYLLQSALQQRFGANRKLNVAAVADRFRVLQKTQGVSDEELERIWPWYCEQIPKKTQYMPEVFGAASVTAKWPKVESFYQRECEHTPRRWFERDWRELRPSERDEYESKILRVRQAVDNRVAQGACREITQHKERCRAVAQQLGLPGYEFHDYKCHEKYWYR